MGAMQTEVIDFTPDEYQAFLGRELKAALGLDLPTFFINYASGELDEADPEVARIAALLGVGQNGH